MGAPVLLPITSFRHPHGTGAPRLSLAEQGQQEKPQPQGLGSPRNDSGMPWAHRSPYSGLETLCRSHHGWDP